MGNQGDDPSGSGPSVLPPGQALGQIGKYELLDIVGEGAMGVVYHARDPFLDRDVALKVMLPKLASDVEKRHRFEREARAVAKLMHVNVVGVFDLGYHVDGSPYIAMEFLQGQDLSEALRSGEPLPLETRIGIVLQVLDGLDHAHRAGIVHRDIKPANIFLNRDGVAKIMDFGVARFTAASISAAGLVVGTPNYMSPEQASGDRVDHRADLFSVGCTFAELITGRTPFVGANFMATIHRIVNDEPDLAMPEDAASQGLLPILRHALEKDREKRFESAARFAEVLREYSRELPASEPAPADRPVASASAPPVAAVVAPPAPEPPQEPGPPSDPTELFRLMRQIYTEHKSGHLYFAHGRQHRSLRIVKGHVSQGTTDVLGEHLGDVLVRYGRLRQEDLNRATKVVLGERKRLGVVLDDMGIMSKDTLEAAVGLHVREILFNVGGRGDGTCFFEERVADTLEARDLTSKISMIELVLETARRFQEPEVVRRVLGDLGRPLSLSTHPLLRTPQLPLTPTEGFILSRIDGVLTAAEVVSLIPLPPDDTERSLFALLCTGVVEYPESA